MGRNLMAAGVAVAFLLGGIPAAWSDQPAGSFVVPDKPRPGEIARFSLILPPGVRGGEVSLDGRTLPGFVTGGILNVYMGIDLDVKPGPHEVSYKMGSVSGSWQLEIGPREFASEALTVEPKYTDLDKATLDRVGKERARLAKIWKSVTAKKLWAKSFIKPAAGPNGSPFGLRRIFNSKPRSPHSGLDIKAPAGSTIYASNSGVVVLASELFFTGNTVVIDHGLGLYTIYAHMSRIDVKEGKSVERSQQLGLVGATGRVTGPHLHWAVKLGGARVDPSTLPGVLL